MPASLKSVTSWGVKQRCRVHTGCLSASGSVDSFPSSGMADRNVCRTSMLKNIPPILSPELFLFLMQMGHGDELVIADGNFPAESNAQRIARADGHAAMPLLEGILKFLPIDESVADVAVVMRPTDRQAPEP